MSVQVPNLIQDDFVCGEIVGKALPSGGVVLAHHADTRGYVLVLAFIPENLDDHFATWRVNPETGHAFWGDYFDNLEDAFENYKQRRIV